MNRDSVETGSVSRCYGGVKRCLGFWEAGFKDLGVKGQLIKTVEGFGYYEGSVMG